MMAEISREDHIKRLKQINDGTTYNTVTLINGLTLSHKDTLDKAISDMEKLEKIEKILDDKTYNNCKSIVFDIRNVLRGGEE